MVQVINQIIRIIVLQELLHCHVLVITCISDQLHVISGKPLLFSQFYGKTDLHFDCRRFTKRSCH